MGGEDERQPGRPSRKQRRAGAQPRAPPPPRKRQRPRPGGASEEPLGVLAAVRLTADSADWHARERGLARLERWLGAQDAADAAGRGRAGTEQQLRQVWEGLFFTFWHSDKAPVQAQLSRRLAGLVRRVPEGTGLRYLEVFVQTMRRRWMDIDRHRLDKFLMLLRHFLQAMFLYLSRHDWDPEYVAKCTALITASLAESRPGVVSVGVSLHFADIFVEELEAACRTGEDFPDMVPGDSLTLMFEPFVAGLATNRTKSVRERIAAVFKALAERALLALGNLLRGVASLDGVPYIQLDAQSLGEALFAAASDPATAQPNRELLYDLLPAFRQIHSLQVRLTKEPPPPTESPVGDGPAPQAESASEEGSSSSSSGSEAGDEAEEDLEDSEEDALVPSASSEDDSEEEEPTTPAAAAAPTTPKLDTAGRQDLRKKLGRVHFRLRNNKVKEFNKFEKVSAFSPSTAVPSRSAMKAGREKNTVPPAVMPAKKGRRGGGRRGRR